MWELYSALSECDDSITWRPDIHLSQWTTGRRTYGVDCRERLYLRALPVEMHVWGFLRAVLESPGRILAMLEERQDTGVLDREITGA